MQKQLICLKTMLKELSKELPTKIRPTIKKFFLKDMHLTELLYLSKLPLIITTELLPTSEVTLTNVMEPSEHKARLSLCLTILVTFAFRTTDKILRN